VVGSYTRNVRTVGHKPRRSLRAAWKLLDANKSSMVQVFDRYNRFGGDRGCQEMMNTSSGALGQYYVPCHLYDLTSTNNIVGTSAVAFNPYLQPDFSNITDTGVLSWAPNIGYNGKDWALANTSIAQTFLDSYPSAECTLDWVSIKLLVYVPAAQTARFSIDVVQFTDTRVVPGEIGPYATAFWQAAIKKFAFSPLESGGMMYNKHIKRLHTQSFIMEPKETIEVEGQHVREVNIFMRLNRACRYDWAQQDPMYLQQLDTQVNLGNNTQRTVEPKKRIFLMIRGQATYTSTFSFDVSKHPSYDIIIRKKQSQLVS